MAQDTSLRVERRRYTKSSSFIMALLFTILCGCTAISLGYFINYFAKGHFVQSTEAVLNAEIDYIEAVGYQNGLPEKDHQIYVFLRDDGVLPSYISSSVSSIAEGIIVFDHLETKRRFAAKIHITDDERKILVGFDITDISKDFKFMQWLGIASIIFVIIVVFVSYLISFFVVQGTNKIADTAREIMDTGDLSRRVEVGMRWDDLSNSAAVLNSLLDRIQELMKGVRQVSDNIAHDLRTPLTRMRNQIEDLQDKNGDEDYSKLLEECDQLLATFNALLRISRIESEKQRSHFKSIDLKLLLEDVAAFYEPLAEDKGITLTHDLQSAHCHGDRDFLFQAYINLLDNAVKFTPKGGVVHVALYEQDGSVYVEISDSGPGVSDDEKDKIFQRFYRCEASRTSLGTGLGLSLVAAVIDLHGGAIKVESQDPGLKIITIF